jgi:hypothetical protein
MSAICECLVSSPESETCGMCISFMSGNRENSEVTDSVPEAVRSGKAKAIISA